VTIKKESIYKVFVSLPHYGQKKQLLSQSLWMIMVPYGAGHQTVSIILSQIKCEYFM